MVPHILLIDDDADEMDFFLHAQKEMQHLFTCSYLNNPGEAVNTIHKLQPDLVFLDINMPGINGFDCLRQIKDDAKFDKPVLFYSTSIDAATQKKAAALGAADCVQKPVMVSSFKKMLLDILNKFK